MSFMQQVEYNFSENEKKVQKKWSELNVFKTNYHDINKEKYYMLETIYYPSGKLHMGHCRVFTIGDAIARFKRMESKNLLHPMGADAFGMPAENAAIDNGIHPSKWTYENTDKMNSQIDSLGYAYDWDISITTCDPHYYKHEQKMFIDFYKNNLAYQKESIVNWDPIDQTVLANEQVENGRGWRSGALVEQKKLKQWFFRISKYSDELLDAIPNLDWPEKIKKTQINWIGKSEGAEIDFEIIENNDAIKPDREVKNFIFDFDSTIIKICSCVEISMQAGSDLATAEKFETMFQDVAKGLMEYNEYIEKDREHTVTLKITKEKVQTFANTLKNQISDGLEEIVKLIQKEGHNVFIVSSGYLDFILPVAEYLGIKKENCFANYIDYNSDGFFCGTVKNGLVLDPANGKPDLIKRLKSEGKIKGEVIMIGDGSNDLSVFKQNQCDHFIGFGLNKVNQTVEKDAPVFVYNSQEFKREIDKIIKNKITVFSTRPDTIFGATFIAISPDYWLALEIAKNNKEIKDFLEECKKESTKTEDLDKRDKKGIFTGLYCKHPLENRQIPIWIANFVLIDYGTGAIMGVPSDDLRDFEFSQKYGLEIKYVVSENGEAVIENDRFYLRKTCENDIELYNSLMKEENLIDKSDAKYAPRMDGNLKRQMDRVETFGFSKFTVVDKANNKPIGYCGFEFLYDPHKTTLPENFILSDLNNEFQKIAKEKNCIHSDGSSFEVELGYRYINEYWGKGYATEIGKLTIEWLFKKFDKLNQIVAIVKQDNKPSQRVLEKLGFEYICNVTREKEDGNLIFYILKRVNFINIKQTKEYSKWHNFEGSRDGHYIINSDFLTGLKCEEAKKVAIEKIEKLSIGKKIVKFRLRDWGVSRQRYWGCPIPIVYCKDCGTVSEKEENLPITLPQDVRFDGKGNPLENHPTWKHCKCPKCGQNAIRETDTLDTFVESSWYFLRYVSPKSEEFAFDKQLVEKFMPVDNYVCGAEHAVSHLLYSRFFMRALRDCGYFEGIKIPMEPFKKLIVQGTVCHKTYKTLNGKWVYPTDVVKQDGKFYDKNTQEEVIEGDSIKMSKSKKNIVDPDYMLEHYGADAMRMFILSDSPIDKDLQWDQSGIEGVSKYLKRLYRLFSSLMQDIDMNNLKENQSTEELEIVQYTNKAIFNYENAFNKFDFNVLIAKMRELTNYVGDLKINTYNQYAIYKALKTLCLMLNPIVPHIADLLWSILKIETNILNEKWISADLNLLKNEQIEISIQINGKLKGTILVPKNSEKEFCIQEAKKIANVNKLLSQGVIKKEIFVLNKVINFVI